MQKNISNKAIGEDNAKSKKQKVAGSRYMFPTHGGITIKANSAKEAREKLAALEKQKK